MISILMKINYLLIVSVTLATAQLSPLFAADEPDETPVMKEMQRRQGQVDKLSIDDQLKLRAAQQKAMENPEVKAAMEKRDKAIVEFREALRAAMMASDPSIRPILEKIAAGASRGI